METNARVVMKRLNYKVVLMVVLILSLLYLGSKYETGRMDTVLLHWKRDGGAYRIYCLLKENEVYRIEDFKINEIPKVYPGDKITLSRRLVGRRIESVQGSIIDKESYLFYGLIFRRSLGEEWDLEVPFKLTVIQEDSICEYNFNARWYYCLIRKDKDAQLVIEADGYKTKVLKLSKRQSNKTESIIESNCLMEEGFGTVEKQMDID